MCRLRGAPLMERPSPGPKWELERYRPVLRLLAWQLHLDPRLRCRFDGSDLVQETFLQAVAARDQFRGTSEGELIRWLQEILHNKLRDMVRRERAQQRTPELEASLQAVADSSVRLDCFLSAGQSSPSERVEREEVLCRWAAAVEQLPAEQREVVLLRDLHQLPVKEIAGRLERTEKS